VGGVLSMRTEHFQRVNGYSNLYWGWGAEDDDMAYRLVQYYVATYIHYQMMLSVSVHGRRLKFDSLRLITCLCDVNSG